MNYFLKSVLFFVGSMVISLCAVDRVDEEEFTRRLKIELICMNQIIMPSILAPRAIFGTSLNEVENHTLVPLLEALRAQNMPRALFELREVDARSIGIRRSELFAYSLAICRVLIVLFSPSNDDNRHLTLAERTGRSAWATLLLGMRGESLERKRTVFSVWYRFKQHLLSGISVSGLLDGAFERLEMEMGTGYPTTPLTGGAFADAGIGGGVGAGVGAAGTSVVDTHEQSAQAYRLFSGDGVVQNKGEARLVAIPAASRGDAAAQYLLGHMHYTGEGAPQNDVLAREWAERSALQHHPKGQSLFAECLLFGKGISPDYNRAKEFAELAAGHNDSHGLYLCALILYEGRPGVSQDPVRAFRYAQDAMFSNDARVQLLFARMYYYAQGTPQNLAEAFRLAKASTDQGNREAEAFTAELYYRGQGVVKNKAEAFRLANKATSQGSFDGKYILARCYRRGHGVAKDKAMAKRYLQEAAARGHQRSQELLDRMTSCTVS